MTARKVGRQTKLDSKLQTRICGLLSKCVTVTDACGVVGIHKSTYYAWLARAEAEAQRLETEPEGTEPYPDETPFLEFLDAVTRAEAKAKEVAAKTIHNAMLPYDVKESKTETFTETRLSKNGEPYEYKKQTDSEVTRSYPGDWRAAVEYLKRRDADQWSERQEISGKDGGAIPIRVEYVDRPPELPPLPSTGGDA